MRTKTGIITSKSGEKTVVVTVHRYEKHPKYHKKYRVSKKFHAHTENQDLNVGDEVVIAETRPLSKMKRWRVLSAAELSDFSKK